MIVIKAIISVMGKHCDYSNGTPQSLAMLLSTTNFKPSILDGSGNLKPSVTEVLNSTSWNSLSQQENI
jgi:hypothetical protein